MEETKPGVKSLRGERRGGGRHTARRRERRRGFGGRGMLSGRKRVDRDEDRAREAERGQRKTDVFVDILIGEPSCLNGAPCHNLQPQQYFGTNVHTLLIGKHVFPTSTHHSRPATHRSISTTIAYCCLQLAHRDVAAVTACCIADTSVSVVGIGVDSCEKERSAYNTNIIRMRRPYGQLFQLRNVQKRNSL